MANVLTDVFNWLGNPANKDKQTEVVKTDIALAVGDPNGSAASAIRSRSKMLGRALSYEFKGPAALHRPGSSSFTRPVYDLAEVARAADVEPYVDQSIRKHREMILKEGYTIEGNDDTMVDYIKSRLFEIALITGIPTDNLIREGITNLVKYHNSAYVLRRDMTRSKGRSIRMYGKRLEPIAGIFVLDPTTLAVKVDKYGTPKRWEQRIEGESGNHENSVKRFAPEDVIFSSMDKNTGFSFGTPYILPVLDDVRALRRLEELAVMLASKEVFPLYHYKIGTDALPAMQLEGGLDEVDLVKGEVQNMPLQGNLITSHRHDVNLVSREGGALDINPFLEYFEARVMGGLRLSALDLGRGGTANRACYSGDTETLTDKGWKNHWEIDTDTDLIATYNPETKKLEFHKANSKHVYPYSGKMYHFKSRMSDILVTPDHDMWLRLSSDAEWKKVHAEEIPENESFHFQLQVDWNTQGKKIQPIQIGDHPDIPADTWLTFLAHFLQYGKVTPSRNEMKLIVRNRLVAETLKEFIASLPFDFRVYDNDDYVKFAVNDIDLVKHLSMACSCRTYPKRIPNYVIHSDNEDLKAFLDVLVPPEVFDGANIYYARTYALAGQVQEIAFKLGYNAKVLAETRKPRVVISYGADTEELSHDDIDIVDYDGDVYCFNVPNHLFITRRNGKVAIHGNTATNINKNVQDASKDYQQAFSTSISYALFLPMLLEGGFNVNRDNMVFLTFPAIDREELRAHQNHGMQAYMNNVMTCGEVRKQYFNLPDLSEEDKKGLIRNEDAEVEEKLTRVAAAVKPTPASSTSKNTASAKKSTTNKSQPRNQSGTKATKTRTKANDYISALRTDFDRFRDRIIMLVESDQDEVGDNTLELQLRSSFGELVTNCMAHGKNNLQEQIEDGTALAIELDGHQDEEIIVGRRATSKFFTNCVEKSFWKTVSPYRDRVCNYVHPDAEGNSPRYMVYGALSSMWLSLERLANDQLEAAKRFGFAKAARTLGYVSMHMENTESGDRKTIELNKGPIVYKNLIPELNDNHTQILLGSKLIEDSSDA
jgi:hypothetical protein